MPPGIVGKVLPTYIFDFWITPSATCARTPRSRISWTTPWHFLVSRFRRDRALVVYLSVRSDLQGKGIMGAMLARLLPEMQQAGYKRLGITWIWDENRGSLRQMERIGAKPLHRTHLFRKSLAADDP